ncbi:MAG: NolF secretion protein [Acidobacteriaceae bacterium]|nr:NolF secretion protein [Acidobacteriaceae bacterium]
MKRTLLFLTGIVIVAAMIFQARSFDANANMPSNGKDTTARTNDTRGHRITGEGRVSTYPGAQVIVASDAAGTVVRLLVDEKSVVHAGDVIAEIRAEDTRAAIAQARARVNESDADVRLFEAEVNRSSELYESKVGTKQALDHARRDLDAALARRETASADQRRLEAILDKTLVRAPISGIVTLRSVQQGESVKEQQPIVTIADLRKIRIEAEVDEFDAGRVSLGSEVTVKAEGYDGQQWTGKIEEIPDSVVARKLKPEDPGRPTDTRVLLVKVALLEKTPLKLGQRVEMEIKGK